MTKEAIELGVQRRIYSIDVDAERADVDEEKREVAFAFSSEEPYERWWGTEILGHKRSEVDLDWLKSTNAPLLLDHDTRVDSQVGRIVKVSLDQRTGRGVARFGKGARSDEIFQRVKDGELTNISVGYRINQLQLVEANENGPDTFRVTDWKPVEASIVTVPADETVGFGREEVGAVRAVTIQTKEEPLATPAVHTKMTQEELDELKVAAREGADKENKDDTGETQTVDTSDAHKASKGAGFNFKKSARPDDDDEGKSFNPDDILRDERKRTGEIEAIAKQHNVANLGAEAIQKGISVAQFKGIVLEHLGDSAEDVMLSKAEKGLTPKEAQSFRFTRLFAALANPGDVTMRNAAAFELEVVEAPKKRDHAQVTLPVDVLRQGMVPGAEQQRDLTVGTATAGGHTVATNLLAQDFITLLRSRTLTQRLGARMMMGLDGNIAIPRQTGGATHYWLDEGDNTTESQQAFDQVTMSPTTIAAFVDMSRRLLLQSSLDIEAFVRQDLALTLALGIDYGALHGTGASNQPTGVAAQVGINAISMGTPNGGAPTWGKMVDMETEVAADDADIGSLAYLFNARVRGKLKQTEKASGTAQFIMPEGRDADGFGEVNGYRAGVSNQVRSDLTEGTGTALSAAFFGNWADLIIGGWSGLDVLVDPLTLGLQGALRIIVMQDIQTAVRHPQSFSYANDIITT